MTLRAALHSPNRRRRFPGAGDGRPDDERREPRENASEHCIRTTQRLEKDDRSTASDSPPAGTPPVLIGPGRPPGRWPFPERGAPSRSEVAPLPLRAGESPEGRPQPCSLRRRTWDDPSRSR